MSWWLRFVEVRLEWQQPPQHREEGGDLQGSGSQKVLFFTLAHVWRVLVGKLSRFSVQGRTSSGLKSKVQKLVYSDPCMCNLLLCKRSHIADNKQNVDHVHIGPPHWARMGNFETLSVLCYCVVCCSRGQTFAMRNHFCVFVPTLGCRHGNKRVFRAVG